MTWSWLRAGGTSIGGGLQQGDKPSHLAKVLLPENYFPVSRCHTLATSASFLSCTDDPHLSVGGSVRPALDGF